ncbi:hypothetical protein KVR01_003849 [Diaporthe batatas]|uniref:uncharacterized protein n=1 Tax=Diaporthe batatas TaxID=748121 RepID=UPI001D0517BB|nr:uncharacterized protein KVR01_003849 [Diaporthe batatas]KAG8168160.1 hypothetical protein KVR01_003849 [Diaporthe batatas]
MQVCNLIVFSLLSWSPITSGWPTAKAGPQRRDAKIFAHPGALHTSDDFKRVQQHVRDKEQPWYRAWQHLESTKLAQTTWVPTPQEVIVRGAHDEFPENYGHAYRDAHSAYQLALRWQIGGNTSYADHAAEILDGWGSSLVDIAGNEDKYLAAGLYGYQFANAAEILRGYSSWPKTNQKAFGAILNNIFAVYNREFLERHNNKQDFYYANWDLCNIASLMAIGIFNDNRTMYDYAVDYFEHGLPGQPEVVANGALPYFSIANFTEDDTGKTLMQIQESGRDQAHSLLCISLLGVIGQQGWNQGVDLYSVYGHQILNAAEYVAKYNTNHTVPYIPYQSWEGELKVVSEKARFDVRPGFEALCSHYTNIKILDASWSLEYRKFVNANLTENIEGGGGDYSPNSGGYDALGHGTLMYRIDREE